VCADLFDLSSPRDVKTDDRLAAGEMIHPARPRMLRKRREHRKSARRGLLELLPREELAVSLNLMILGLIVWFACLPAWFFKRRIGGAGGGSDADMVGVLWFVATLAFGIYLTRV
jgi:hypothetical protein